MLELCSFYLAVGGKPQGLKLGVVNEELGNFSTCEDLKTSLGDLYGGKKFDVDEDYSYCMLRGLSCKFLEKVTDDMVLQVSALRYIL